MDNFVSAIIVAAGSSSRMGLQKSKQFIDLLGDAVISHTLRAFENCGIIDSVVVVCRAEDEEEIRRILSRNGYKKVLALVHGGKERDESVRNGIEACDARTTHFAIHDGARPLIHSDDIEAVVWRAFETSAAALGSYVTDTIKVVDENNRILSTPDRDTLRAVQTPQVFEKNLYLRALENARDKSMKITDDCKLVEETGESVQIVLGIHPNIKLTTQGDIAVAEEILRRRRL